MKKEASQSLPKAHIILYWGEQPVGTVSKSKLWCVTSLFHLKLSCHGALSC